jgi:mRNA-degrading endonuclease RelE of RelBE toxin-antitoxin system
LLPSPQEPERYRVEFLPEVADDANELSEDLRKAIARIVVDLHSNPWRGDPMDERPPRNLEGCRKVRFDAPDWRYRFVYRNEPSDGAVGVMVVLAIGRRDNMIAYAKASAWLARRLTDDARGARGRRPER